MNIKKNSPVFLQTVLFLVMLGMVGCNTYRQNIMFQSEVEINPLSFSQAISQAERNYIIIPGDVFIFRLYTNKGERIIDPTSDMELQQGINPTFNPQLTTNYTVRPDGSVMLPMIGELKVSGYAMYQLDSLLSKSYALFYKDPFVISQISSRRVVVLGGLKSGVVPLVYENMNLIEILAISGGPEEFSRVKNIRLIRGDLSNPSVQLIDLSTIAGMQKASLKLQPNDIIYLEPISRTAIKATTDLLPIVATFINLFTVLLLISRF